MLTIFLLCILSHLSSLFVCANQQSVIPSEFVATYSHGDERGGFSLTLNSQGRFFIYYSTFIAEYFTSGTYAFSDDLLYLTVKKKMTRLFGKKRATNLLSEQPEDSKDPDFRFLKWSGRLYLLASNDWEVLNFCNAINLGVEPRKHLYAGEFLLRNGDEKKDVADNPPLPGNWSSYLLSQPVTATVVKIEREGSWNESKIVVIDKGSKDGLKVGMILMGEALTDEEPTFLFDPKVISVEEHTARVKMNYNERLRVGDWISTRFIPGPFYQWWAT